MHWYVTPHVTANRHLEAFAGYLYKLFARGLSTVRHLCEDSRDGGRESVSITRSRRRRPPSRPPLDQVFIARSSRETSPRELSCLVRR